MEMCQKKNWTEQELAQMEACGRLVELTESQKYGAIFGGAIILAGVIMSTVVFPFWNLIREDVYEHSMIISSSDGTCYANTEDQIPKTIQNCYLEPGTPVQLKYGKGLAWATIVP
jgi:hypothetical protein